MDQKEVVDSLTNEQAGVLFKTIFKYHNNEEYSLDNLLNIAFIPFKQTFKRDGQKWEVIREERSKAGRIGGLNKAKNLANVAKASKSKQKLANVAVSGSVSVSVSEKTIYNKNSKTEQHTNKKNPFIKGKRSRGAVGYKFGRKSTDFYKSEIPQYKRKEGTYAEDIL